MKPRVFLASSVQGLDVAYSVQEALDYYCEITVWPQGVFDLTKSTLDALVEQAGKFDAAIFVFSPDDAATVRGSPQPIVRDNVVFELGLFIGKIGKDNCFIIKPRSFSSIYFPTDILGLTAGDYDDSRSDGNLIAAVGPSCSKIRRALIPFAPSPTPTPAAGGDLASFLLTRTFRLFYQPPTFSKRIVFARDGTIAEGNNKNEHKWRIVGDKLELLQLDGRVHSRFFFDPSKEIFTHTNDADTLSLPDQFIRPESK